MVFSSAARCEKGKSGRLARLSVPQLLKILIRAAYAARIYLFYQSLADAGASQASNSTFEGHINHGARPITWLAALDCPRCEPNFDRNRQAAQH